MIRTAAYAAHRLLMVTRWTGVALPVTGAYLVWALYRPIDLLTGTPRGWAVLAMLSLWGVMNGLVEIGILRMRREVDPDIGLGRYMAEGFPVEALDDRAPTAPESARLAAVARPYLLASAGVAVLLLVDAALLAGGVPG
ncbi:copper resistance protein CopD [Halorubrum sp. BOL3-1]|uniref:copper resistance protein CopD n=1 Tax=Halorubrum sp. BOL3-1 TaxID=2497325 RepID=UPI001F4F34DC|nr:copper resistance protein CopD [Halorubrum sp. BOL3-1]